MTRSVQRDGKRSGYINVPFPQALFTDCDLAARNACEKLHDWVYVACQQRLHRQHLDEREDMYRAARERAYKANRAPPTRDEYWNMNGWDE